MHVHCIGGQLNLTYRVSFSNSVRRLILGGTCSCTARVTSTTFVCVLILRNLDVLGLVVGLLQGDLLDDPGRLHFDFEDDMFFHGVRQLSVDFWFHEPAPLPCKFPSVCLHLAAVSF